MTSVAPARRRFVDALRGALVASPDRAPESGPTGSRGFTFLEIALLLAIVGLVVAIAVPTLGTYIARAKVVESVTDIGAMSAKIKQYEASKGTLPNSLAEVDLGGKLDPWGYPYEYYNLTSTKGNGQARKDKKLAPLNSDFDLYSIGRDGLTSSTLGNSRSRDDVVRARDGGFIGLASDFDP